jgi:hypothetical protein
MIVFIPGATEGGPYITKLRTWLHGVWGDEIYIPSSVSTKYGYKPNETLEQRYIRLALEIKQFNHDELIIITHSLGALETPFF